MYNFFGLSRQIRHSFFSSRYHLAVSYFSHNIPHIANSQIIAIFVNNASSLAGDMPRSTAPTAKNYNNVTHYQ